MALTADQVKGRIKNLAKQNGADARALIRIYMMERFLERVSVSKYADNFIIKGGILVTSMVGIAMRSTMDIDTSLRNLNLSGEDACLIVNEIASIDLGDDSSFRIKEVSGIMDEMEYPGIRITVDALMGKMITPIKIDISTGDSITPKAIEYSYKLMLEDRSINLWSYNLETILAEKLQTVLVRGVLNTRMRDFYDIHTLLMGYSEQIDNGILKQAFITTCEKRGSLQLRIQGAEIIREIAENEELKSLWSSYQRKYVYAADITYQAVIDSVTKMYDSITTEP
jgi:predicted nucleotidyltransferase component of viral defense system